MKLFLTLILICFLCSSLNCANNDENFEQIDGSFIFQLRKNTNDMNRFKGTISQHITSNYIREDSYFNISWQKNDSYNKDKTNYSIFPIIDFGLHFIVYKDSGQWELNPENLLSPYFLLNSSHYFLLNKMTYNFPTINLALFVKNNTDLFVFEKNNWAQLSPGLGARIFLGGQYGLTIEAGIENKSVYLFKDKRIINSSCFFFSLGILSGPV